MKTPTTYPEIIKPADMSIALLWVTFAGHVLPADAPPIQRDEMKKAFYTGFTECFKVMTDYATALDEKTVVQLFDRLNKECITFYERMKKEHPL